MRTATQSDLPYPPPDEWMTRQEAADYLGLSIRCLEMLAKLKHPTRNIPYVKWRNRAWYQRTVVAAFKERMASNEFAPYRTTAVYEGPRPSAMPLQKDVEDSSKQGKMDALLAKFGELHSVIESLTGELKTLKEG